MEWWQHENGKNKDGAVDVTTFPPYAIPACTGVTSTTTGAKAMPTFRPINVYGGITPSFSSCMQADDAWSTADGLFRRKPAVRIYETPTTTDRRNPFHEEVMAADAMRRTPKATDDKVDALLTALQVLTDTLNSGQSFRQLAAVGDRSEAAAISDGPRDVRHGIPRDDRRDDPRDVRHDIPRGDPRDVRRDAQDSRLASPTATDGTIRRPIKIGMYDGTTAFETFMAKFTNAAEYNRWAEADQLAHMKACLSGSAANVLWDTAENKQNTLQKLSEVLATRFGSTGMAERYRCELRSRKRRPGESLQVLHQEIQRLASLAFRGPWSEATDVIARDAFIDALLDGDLALKIREREPATLDQAVKIAIRLESYVTAAASDRRSDGSQAQVRATSSDGNINATAAMELLSHQLQNTTQRLNELEKLPEQNRVLQQQLQQCQWQLANMAGNMNQQAPPLTTTDYSTTQPPNSNDGSSWYRSRQQRFNSGQRRPGACFACGQVGHFSRQCPTKVGSTTGPADESRRARGGNSGRKGCPVYIDLSVGRWTVACLLDTGCDISLMPGRFAGNSELKPCSLPVTAANGTNIKIIGSKVFHIKLNGIAFDAEMLVSNDVEEAMLGVDFLGSHDCTWQINKGIVTIDSQVLKLHSGRHGVVCRRVYCQDTTVIPAFSQKDVVVSLPLRNVNDSSESLLLDATQLRAGVTLASCVLPCDATCAMVRVCNTNQRDVTFKKGVHLSSAYSTDVVEAPDISVNEKKQGQGNDTNVMADKNVRAEKVHAIIDQLCSQLPDKLSTELQRQVRALLFKYEAVLSVDDYDLGYTDILTHKIDTGSNRPVREPLRRQPPPYLQFIDEEVEKMLTAKVIEPAHSDWASNVCLAKRKDGRLRFAIDFRRVNRLTKPDSYPLPRIDSCLDMLNGSSWFCTIDLRSGFWQVAQDPADADKTTFLTRKGSFRFKVLPFGLQGSPSLFQRVMDLVLAGLTWQTCLVYLDDIIAFSRTPEDLLVRLDQIFQRLKQHNLKLKPSKLCLFQQELIFLGYKISADGIGTDPEKTRTVLDMAPPRNVKELRSTMGCFGYYRRFISSFSQIAEPLFALLRKGEKFIWTSSHQRAFDLLKTKLASAPVLALPCDDAQTVLDVDASDSGLGAVLSNVINGEERPVAYASRTYNPCEKSYCITRRELLALIFGLKHFRQYCLGRHVIVRTDHAPLLAIKSNPNPSAQMCRWLDLIEEMDITILHRPGIRHGNADGCSRAQSACKQCTLSAASYQRLDNLHAVSDQQQATQSNPTSSDTVTSEIDVTSISTGVVTSTAHQNQRDAVGHSVHRSRVQHTTFNMDFAAEQQVDPDIKPVLEALSQSETMPDWVAHNKCSEDTKNLLAQWPLLSMQNGMLCRKWIDGRQQTRWWQCVIPFSCREKVMQMAHTGMTGGHYGVKKTCFQVKRRAYWKSWRHDCTRFVRQCPQCATYHRGKPPKPGELQDMQTGSPFERVGIDLTGPWAKSENKVYILTFIDHFTKWADAIPLPNKEAVTVANALVSRIFTQVGVPLQILSDQGKEFDNNLMMSLCNKLGVDKVRTSPYHAATNGCTERMHRSINSMLAKCVDENQRNWATLLPQVMAAYRCAVHESTGYSPNFLHFGREVRTPIDLLLPPQIEDLSVDDFVARTQKEMHYAYNLAREQLATQMSRRKTYYEMNLKPRQFQPGDWVWYFYPRRRQGRSQKWERMYVGPFLIIDQCSPVTFQIQKSEKADPQIVHVDKLKLAEVVNQQSWLQPGIWNNTIDEVIQPSTDLNTPNNSDQGPSGGNSDAATPSLGEINKPPGRRRVRQPRWLADYAC